MEKSTLRIALLIGKDGVDERGNYTVDINQLLSDSNLKDKEKIWRVITNGYPYKSFEGLTDKEAYFATKQAIYCVIIPRSTSLYTGMNDKGDKIVQVIKSLVEKGLDESINPKEANLKVTKSGDFIENGNYYSQNYIVTSSVEIGRFQIEKISGFPDGSFIADNNGKEKTSFTSGENSFKIMIPKSKLTQNINGVISVTAKCKTYPILIGKTRIENTQDYAITGDAFDTFEATATLNVATNTGKVQVKKIDSENSKPIQGAEFELLKTDGTKVATVTTNSQGIALFSNLYQGSYILKEIATDKNYILDSNIFNIDVTYNNTTTKTITNNPKKGNLRINKTDSETSDPIKGITFQLLDLDGNIVQTDTTDSNGEIYFQNLRIGKYKLKETDTNSNYVLNSTVFDVEIEYNKTTIKDITNDYKKGNIKINKTDSETSDPIEGVTFQLLDLNGNIVSTAITNENGEAYFNNIRIGSYKLKEISTKINYILNTTIFDVEVEYNKTAVIDITNEYQRGSLLVNKVDADNNKITLGNVIFDLYSNEFKRVIGTYATDVDGEFSIEGLRIGTYKLIEKNTGKWYNLAENTEININWNETTHTMIENELKKGQIKVIKVDKENSEVKLEGVEFEVLDENDNILETIVTDKNGEALTSKYPIRDFSKLKIREVKTLESYVLCNEVKTIKLNENEIVSVIFENEIKKGNVEITKISADDNKLTGEKKGTLLKNAVFEIYTENNELVDTIITGEDGKAISKLLNYGNYYIKEKESGSKYYLLNTKKYHFEIKENGEIVPIIIENTSVKPRKQLPKTGF